MKVRMMIAEYEEYDTGNPVPQAYLACVSFPTTVEPVYVLEEDLDWHDPDDEDTLTLHTEAQLAKWARHRFVSHEVWDMEVPDQTVTVSVEGGVVSGVDGPEGIIVEVRDASIGEGDEAISVYNGGVLIVDRHREEA